MRVSLGRRDGARPCRMEGQSPLDGEMGHGSLEWRDAATLSVGERGCKGLSRTEGLLLPSRDSAQLSKMEGRSPFP